MKEVSAYALLHNLQEQVNQGNFNDSVHKIKLMTAIEIIEKTLKQL